jgi:hypothetical protein
MASGMKATPFFAATIARRANGRYHSRTCSDDGLGLDSRNRDLKPSSTTSTFPRTEPECVPGSALLEAWSSHDWSEGVQVDRLRDLDILHVRTRNTLYEITIICAQTGEAVITGGRFFTERTRAVVLGCSLGGAFLKLRGVYRGFSLELYARGMRIVTSPVHSIHPVPDHQLGLVQ